MSSNGSIVLRGNPVLCMIHTSMYVYIYVMYVSAYAFSCVCIIVIVVGLLIILSLSNMITDLRST